MATILRRENAQGRVTGYQAQIRKRGFPPQTQTFRTMREARAWAAMVESEMSRGVWRDSSGAESTTLRECLEWYRDTITVTKRSPHPEFLKINQLLTYPLASRYMASIRGMDVAGLITGWTDTGKSPNTIRLYLAILSNLFTRAISDLGMETLVNPVRAVRKPSVAGSGRRRRLNDKAEERVLLQACRDIHPDFEAVVIFAVETAMRRGELAALSWRMVDLSTRVMLLPAEITKGGRSRGVPLSQKAMAVLPPPQSAESKVFDYTADGITRNFRKAAKRAELADLWFHDLRHEATSRLVERGLNPAQVGSITGHSSAEMVAYYTHLRAAEMVTALD